MTPEGAEPRRMRLLGLHHVTAIVADLERTTAFYRDILGLVGMLMGWWQVKLSSGCPPAGRGEPAHHLLSTDHGPSQPQAR